MTATNWAPSLAFVWRSDCDGQPLHTDAHDPGGDTSWGVIATTWAEAVRSGIVTGTLQNATKPQLATVLRVQFWNTVQGDALPAGIDLAVFNMGMVSGPGTAARLLQQAVGVVDDGHIGPVTLLAVRGADPGLLIAALTKRDEAYFASLGTFRYFGRGWDNRAEACQAAALSMAKVAAPVGVKVPMQNAQPAASPPDSTESEADWLNDGQLARDAETTVY